MHFSKANSASYMAAALTGLRKSELQQVVWDDIHLDSDRPHIRVRANTTKNRKEAILPLHPQLVAELQAIRPSEVNASARVFSQHGCLTQGASR